MAWMQGGESKTGSISFVTRLMCGLGGMLLAFGCAGGGGITQVAPDTVKAGDPATITLEVAVWGSGGNIKGRYTDVVTYYRRAGEPEYRTATPTVVSQDAKHQNYQVVVPAYPIGTSGEVEYYIELKLDGQPSRIAGLKKIKIVP
jgi:hypothetical protein